MPFHKKFMKQVSYVGASKRGKIYGAAGYQLYRDVKHLKKIVNVEYKTIDATIDQAVSSAGNVIPLTLCAAGDDFNTRDGRRIKVLSISLRLHMLIHASATDTILRMILFRTKNNQAAVPATTDVLQTVSETSFPEAATHQNSFVILNDRMIALTSVNDTIKTYRLSKQLTSHVDYSGTAATEANMGRGGLYLLLITNEATNAPQVEGSTRVKFVDN